MRLPPFAALAVIVATSSSAAARASVPDSGSCENGELGSRTYILCTAGAAPDQGLIVALHGRGSSAAEMQHVTELDRDAAEAGYAVVYPDGLGGRWGDDTFTSDERPTGNEDVEFLDGLILDLLAEPFIADAPAGIVGFSNGGSMALRYAAERPENVAAVVSVAGQLALDPAVRPTGAVPLLEIYGTADPIRSYEDGVPEPAERQAADSTPTLPTVETVDAFVDLLDEPVRQMGPLAEDIDPADETSVEVTWWKHDDALFIGLYTVVGGGHTWPSAHAPWAVESSIDFGPVSTEFDASAVAVEFISSATAD